MLHIACLKKSDHKILGFLIDNKCSVNARDESECTPLHLVSKFKEFQHNTIKYLLEQKANIDAEDYYGLTPFHYLCEKDVVCLEELKTLVEMKADPKKISKEKRNAFHCVVSKKYLNIDVFNYLFEQKCDPFVEDKFGEVPFHIFCEKGIGSLEVAKFFVEKDPSVVNREAKLQTWFVDKFTVNKETKYIDRNTLRSTVYPINLACRNKKFPLETIRYLVDKKSDLTKISFSQNLLHSSLEREFQLVKFLFDSGAKLFQQDDEKIVPTIRRLVIGRISAETFVVLLSQPEFLFEKESQQLKEPSELIFRDYEKGSLYTFDRNKFFPRIFQQKVFSIFLSLKYYSKRLHKVFPKPLILMIIRILHNEYKHHQFVVRLKSI